jgi:hypothetical protein
MSDNAPPSRKLEYLTKLVLTTTFLCLFIAFVLLFPGVRQRILTLSFLDLVLLSFATFRLGRLISYDLVTEPLRLPFTKTVPDETGAGDSVEARGNGIQHALGQLISCPICSGTWAAAMLTYGLCLFPEAMRLFLFMTAAIGIAEILNGLVEASSWGGFLSRTLAGANLESRRHSPDPKQNPDQ